MFTGFQAEEVLVGDVRLWARFGGSGPPVVLLHGHPRTHATWHAVAPTLAEEFTVVCPDLRGYGRSSKPPTDERHLPYSKRAMADDIVKLMRELGHEQFAVVGHDRGAAVAFRLAMDHPHAATRLVVMDSIPIGEHLKRADVNFASRWWHWFFFGQTEKPAERVISADPDAWYGEGPMDSPPEAIEDYRRAIHDPATVHAMIEDYRAGLTIDRQHDDDDRRAQRRLHMPVMVLWARQDDLADLYGDPVAVWQTWADDVIGKEIDSGHHMAEAAPAEVTAVLRRFLR